MKPDTHSLDGLFASDVRYVVPLYQRPYVWRKRSHWEPLWEDVLHVLDRHLDKDALTRGHFLGAVVLEQEHTNPGEILRRLVIDGQQRLTTLQLLLSAASAELEHAGAPGDARLVRKLIGNDPDRVTGVELLKVWPTNADRAAFDAVMNGTDPPAGESDLVDAHRYFADVIRPWLATPAEHDLTERCKGLRIVLTELLHVVSINLEPGDDAQVIFETLNARGTPLLAMDLVKNAAFHRAEREDPTSTDALHHDVWEPELGRAYWREEQRQGRLKRPRAELFLMHWLTMRLGEVVAAGELFSTFRARVLDSPQATGVDRLIRELCADAGVMRAFDEFPPNCVEGQFFRRLTVLDTTTVLPLVLLLFRDSTIDRAERRRALAALESWLVRRMICGLTTKNYNRAVVELLEVARQTSAGGVDAIIAKLDEWDAPTNRWPRDNEVQQVLATRGMYGWIAQRRLVLVLAGVEARRRESSKTEALLDPSASLSLEHLMPQKWREHWPEHDGISGADRDRRLHLLGNLTLVTSPLNASLSNSAWPVKRGALADHSLLLLNRELAKLEHWTDAAIDERCASLAVELCAVWPAPPTDRELPSAQVAVASERRSYPWTIADLISAGKLAVGEQLRPRSGRHTTPALVAEDGTLEIEGEPFTTPSGAAKRVSGTISEPGWHFWCVQRHGGQATLAELRAELGEAE